MKIMADKYIRKADAVKRMKNYGSVWMEYTEAMSKHEIAEQALKASKQAVIDVLENIEPVDVAPVVHGEWIRSGAEGHIICNKCGYEAKYTIVERQDATGKWTSRFAQDMKTNFCPNCGARMDRG